MGREGGPDPARVRDAAGLVAQMRELRDRSGLTYRQLQRRAAEQGMVLPRSTLSDALARDAVPRPELVEAFVVACGDGARLGEWLEARRRVAEEEAPAVPAVEPRRRAWVRRRYVWPAVAVAVLGLAYGVFVVLPDRPDGDGERHPRVAATMPAAGRGGAFSLFEARSAKGATVASVGYRYWDTGDGWYGIEYVLPYSRDDREAYDDGWGGRLLMHYEDRTGRHTAVLAGNPDGGQRAGADGVRHGMRNVWFEVCDFDGRQARGCQRLRKARS
ncbi:hypothetical protein GCM10010218_15310 [Streptomyces mashuensis]|uniref:Uncharacterized protein n=1 Tax=Streptomyces mashuensis TaxID=33904 RepID=A0A919B0J4_9ACTN|nr:helix-turn-helix domain-containing protein [Streptomyces mashuensis]GHF35073.1 hypothetical protein GCM10010218_15310 [Streptomyces mashuensis]